MLSIVCLKLKSEYICKSQCFNIFNVLKTIHNSQNLKTQGPENRIVDKETVLHSHNGILRSC